MSKHRRIYLVCVPWGLLPLALVLGCGDGTAPRAVTASGAPDHMIWQVQPQARVVSQQQMAEVDIAIVDKDGRTVDTSTAAVSLWVLYPPPDTATMAPAGQSTVNAVQGVARFTTLSVARAGHVTMWAGAASVGVAVSSPFDVLPGAASQVYFTSPPVTSKPGRALPPVVATVADAARNPVTAAVDITVALGANAAGAALTGTLMRPTIGGSATFSDLALDKPGVGYILTATSGALATGSSPAFDLLPLMGATATFSAGDGYACAADLALAGFCWGINDYAQLGSGRALFSTVLTWPVTGGLSFVSISGMNQHTCGLLGNGDAYCWGYNVDGRIGDGTTVSRNGPTQVVGGHSFASISAGGYHTCAVTMTGEGYCWGYNDVGQLGNGTYTDAFTPVLVAGGLSWTAISAGLYHDCGLTIAGEVYCWGFGDDGALGDGSAATSSVPVKVAGSLIYTTVSAGWDFSCAVASTAAAYCWGANPDGELGDGTTGNRSTPTLVGGAHAFTQISTGFYHTCGVASGGAAYCWGYNRNGQLGIGSTAVAIVPAAVAGGLIFRALDAGTEHTCGVTSGNALYCWGLNAYGELGDGTTTQRLAPVAVLP